MWAPQHLFGRADLSFYDGTLTSTVPFWGKFFFQLVFCGTAATIVSGAVAERIKYVSFILFSFVLTLVIYPSWATGSGAAAGWQTWASWILPGRGGPLGGRLGRPGRGAAAGPPHMGKYGRDGKPQAIPGHNMSLAVIGLFVLWLGCSALTPAPP